MRKLLTTSMVACALFSLSGILSANEKMADLLRIQKPSYVKPLPPVGTTGIDTRDEIGQVGFSHQQYKAVNYSFPVVPNTVLNFTHKPSFTQSREYNLEVTSRQLQQGISLKTSAPGALVRISSFNGKSSVQPSQLTLISNQSNGLQKKMTQGSAFDLLVDSQQMRNTGVGFQEGTTGFRISEKVGKGEFILQTNQKLKSGERFLINVFEKNSDTELHLTANKNAYLKREKLQVNAIVFDQGKTQKISKIQGQLIAPNGQSSKVTFSRTQEGYQVNMPLIMPANQTPGALWTLTTELEAEVDGVLIKRSGRVPFAYAEKTAKMATRQVNIVGGAANLQALVPIRVLNASRYEVRGVLYATNNKGKLVPAMVTHSAAFIEAGLGQLVVEFDASILSKSGLGAPFKLKNLQLRDQGQMAVLEIN